MFSALRKQLYSAVLSSEEKFAEAGDLDSCIKYINQALFTCGITSTLELLDDNRACVARACNCIYSLLQLHQKDITSQEDINDERQRLFADVRRLASKVERLEAQLTAKEREFHSAQSREAKSAAGLKAQVQKLQQEKEELQRNANGAQQLRVQHSHELRKKEKEYVRMQERLGQLLSDKKRDSKSVVEVTQPLPVGTLKEGRQRGTWDGKKTDGDFYKMLVDNFEAKKQELLQENVDLKEILRHVQVQLHEMFEHQKAGAPEADARGGREGTEEDGSSGTFASAGPSGQGGGVDLLDLDLPMHEKKEQLERSIYGKLNLLAVRMMNQYAEAATPPQGRPTAPGGGGRGVATDGDDSSSSPSSSSWQMEALRLQDVCAERERLINDLLQQTPRPAAPLERISRPKEDMQGWRGVGAEMRQVAAERAAVQGQAAQLKQLQADLQTAASQLDAAKKLVAVLEPELAARIAIPQIEQHANESSTVQGGPMLQEVQGHIGSTNGLAVSLPFPSSGGGGGGGEEALREAGDEQLGKENLNSRRTGDNHRALHERRRWQIEPELSPLEIRSRIRG
eukprot:jgi/Mesen1/5444/ME000271S04465